MTGPVSGAGSADKAARPIAVFLLDDHEVVRRGVRDLLEAEPDIRVVGEAGTASSALARIPALRPDVAVLDVRFVLRKEDGSAVFGIPHTSAGVIAVEDSGVWAIAVFRNMVPFSWPAAGPVETSVGQTKTA